MNMPTAVYIDPSASVNGVGSEASPYNSLLSPTYAADTTYYVKRGTSEVLSSNVVLSGIDNVTFDAYGTGSSPVLSFYAAISGPWTEVETNVWSADCPPNPNPDNHWDNHCLIGLGVLGNVAPRRMYVQHWWEVDSPFNPSSVFTTYGQWDSRDGNNHQSIAAKFYIYSDEDPATKWGDIFVQIRDNAPIISINSNAIEIKNITFRYCPAPVLFEVTDAGTYSGHTFHNCQVSQCHAGPRLYSGSLIVSAGVIDGAKIYNNSLTDIWGRGIGGSYIKMTNAEIYNNEISGVGYQQSSGAIEFYKCFGEVGKENAVYNNTIDTVYYGGYYSNDGDGIYVDEESRGFEVFNNRVTNLLGGTGLRDNSGAPNNLWYGNVVDNARALSRISDSSGTGANGTRMYNNTGINLTHGIEISQNTDAGSIAIKNNLLQGTRIGIYNQSGATATLTEDHNILAGFTTQRMSGGLGSNDTVLVAVANVLDIGQPAANGNVVLRGEKWWSVPTDVTGTSFTDLPLIGAYAESAPYVPAAEFAAGAAGAYYSVDPTSTFQDNAGTIPASEGDTIRYIADLSGNGRHLIIATAGRALPTLEKNSDGGWYLATHNGAAFFQTSPLSLGASATAAIAIKAVPTSAYQAPLVMDAGAVPSFRFQFKPNNSVYIPISNTSIASGQGIGAFGDYTDRNAASIVLDDGNSYARSGNVAQVTNTYSGSIASSGYTISVRFNWSGEWYGALVVDKAMTQSETANLHAWFEARMTPPA